MLPLSPLLVTIGAFRELDVELRCLSSLLPVMVVLVSVILLLSAPALPGSCTVVATVLLEVDVDDVDDEWKMCDVTPETLVWPHDEEAEEAVSGTVFARLLAPNAENTCCDGPALAAVEELRGCQPGLGTMEREYGRISDLDDKLRINARQLWRMSNAVLSAVTLSHIDRASHCTEW